MHINATCASPLAPPLFLPRAAIIPTPLTIHVAPKSILHSLDHHPNVLEVVTIRGERLRLLLCPGQVAGEARHSHSLVRRGQRQHHLQGGGGKWGDY